MSRAHRSLILLTSLAILSAGTLAQALSSQSSVFADVTTAVSLVVLVTTSTLLFRVLRHLSVSGPPPRS